MALTLLSDKAFPCALKQGEHHSGGIEVVILGWKQKDFTSISRITLYHINTSDREERLIRRKKSNAVNEDLPMSYCTVLRWLKCTSRVYQHRKIVDYSCNYTINSVAECQTSPTYFGKFHLSAQLTKVRLWHSNWKCLLLNKKLDDMYDQRKITNWRVENSSTTEDYNASVRITDVLWPST